MASLQLWQQRKWGTAIVCMVVGSVIGSLLIRTTESKKVAGFHEPMFVTAANMIVITALMFILTTYLLAGWSSWQTDLLVGGLAGIVVATVQNMAAKAPVGCDRHAIALACAGPFVLIGVRMIATALPLWVSIFVITTVMTLMISWIDCWPAKQDK